MKIWAIVTQESMAGVSEKMISMATASFLLGLLEAGNLDLKCFLMGNLVDMTDHEWNFQINLTKMVSTYCSLCW